MVTRVRQIFTIIRFGLLVLRWCGPRVALQKLGHQLYGRTVFLHTESDIDTSIPPSSIPTITIRATDEDVQEIFDQTRNESNAGKYELLIREWYHRRGLGTPYVQKTVDTNEVCSIRWVVTAEDVKRAGFENRYPDFEANEIMYENTYVLERFRNKGIHSALDMSKIMLGEGYKRSRAFIAEDNIAQLRLMRRQGIKVCARVLERHFLFRVSRKTLERYEPPVLVTDILDIE